MTDPGSTSHLLSILIFSPLAAAAVAAFLRRENLLRWWALASTTLIALLSLALYCGFDSSKSAFQFVENAAWVPTLGIRYSLGIDGISLLLVLLTTLIMPLCVLASWRYIQSRLKEFMICLLIMQTAMTGVFCALDFVLFFVFWEAMLIPMALLIGIWGGPRKIYAALKFFIYTMAGSVFLLVAIIALYTQRHTFYIPDLMGQPYSLPFQYWVFLAFFISFAIKVPMFPFHTWLPAAHVEAPTAGSVLLASVLLKMGTYGFLRFSLPITPDATQYFTPYILCLSVAAIIYGGLTALAQTDLKKLVAYSSVAHMGFATLGIFALNQMGIEGAMLVMINHGVTTGALFIIVGIIYERLHTRDLAQASGLGKAMPVFAAFAGVFALSSLAFPGTNSFIGEFLVMSGGFMVSKPMMICVVPGVVLGAAYMLRMLQRVAYGGTRNPDHSRVKDLCWREVFALAPLLVFVFWIGLHPEPFTRVMHASVAHLLEQGQHPGPRSAAVQAKPKIRTPNPSDLSDLSDRSDGRALPGLAGARRPNCRLRSLDPRPPTLCPPMSSFLAFLPELVLLLGALALFFIALGESRTRQARTAALATAFAAIAAAAVCLSQKATLFDGAYSVDLFSQVLKLVFACGLMLILLLSGGLEDVREEVKPEYYLFLTLSVCGLTMLVSCVDIITLVVALEVSAFPLYLLVPMRRERAGRRSQMESAIKYMMFGIAANGIMFFGLSYLYGLTGTTSLPSLLPRLEPVIHTPAAIAGLAMTLCGLYYKLAIFPFHFWTPDVYQGAANETAGLIASLPKLGGVAVLVRLVSLATPDNRTLALLLTILAAGSMFYGNLIALIQKDFKRLLGFSGIAHAGYALIGFVALDDLGYSAALYYITGYLLMVLACFVVICKVSRDGANVSIEELAGLHRRAPLLALTLAVGVFALAGMPPFVGFMGKLSLLTAALHKGHLTLVIITVVNAAIAVYYYLGVVREAWFRDPGDLPAIRLDWPTRALCILLIGGILALGVVPGRVLDTLSTSVARLHLAAPSNVPALAAHPSAPAKAEAGAGQAP